MPSLPTAAVADACLRLGKKLRLAPVGLRGITPGLRVSGPVLPVRHSGSVDAFLEAFEAARSGDVLVIDNEGRQDEACIGDLTVLEAKSAGVAGVLVWGLHRDSVELRRIGLPLFSYGRLPGGPQAVRPRPPDALVRARFGTSEVRRGDWVVADDDGATFVAGSEAEQVLAEAAAIVRREKAQADLVRRGRTLRAQFRFREYLEARTANRTPTFREHLRRIGGEIEQYWDWAALRGP